MALDQRPAEIALSPRLQILEDPHGHLDLAAARSPDQPWADHHRDTLNLGFSRSTWWVRVALRNTTDADMVRVLDIGTPLQDEVDLHILRTDARPPHHARQRTPMALCLLDVDHFKAYNDTHGHQAGGRGQRPASAWWSCPPRPPTPGPKTSTPAPTSCSTRPNTPADTDLSRKPCSQRRVLSPKCGDLCADGCECHTRWSILWEAIPFGDFVERLYGRAAT